MPRWLLETFAQIAIWLVSAFLLLVVALGYAFTWFANGGATSSAPFSPSFQVIASIVALLLASSVLLAARYLLKKLG